MLLTDKVTDWNDAVEKLRHTFGLKKPRKQRKEATDIFVCNARSLLAQLSQNLIPEEVKLYMVYG